MARVIIDTCAWIDFFTRPNSQSAEIVDTLLKNEWVGVTGVVWAELLRGTRTPQAYDLIMVKLNVLPYLETNRESWILAGKLAAELSEAGITLPLTDILISAVAQVHNAHIYTTDSHFSRIPRTPFYRPI